MVGSWPFPLGWAILLALSERLHQRRDWEIASHYAHENLALENPSVPAIAELPKAHRYWIKKTLF
jgi:hypothetical protein